ncbi:hypothetical protein CGCSCA1_v006615 [Colletotrichum siamense]|nr:hypothetical protein CGCSCA1_v006615 [Colletotrichum siamense]
MGPIYTDATLVLAAAGSNDSTEGLFITKRQHPNIFTLPFSPYSLRTGRALTSQGEYNLAILSQESSTPSLGPLHQRAWAYQEWYFAHRKVLFMPGGVSWACSHRESHREYNERWNYSEPQKLSSSWLGILSQYTAKALTYPSDRLVAIRGIATAKTGSSNLFRHTLSSGQASSSEKEVVEDRAALIDLKPVFRFGVWKAQLTEQLLWLPMEKPYEEDDLPNLPSWSWAASGGHKVWPVRHLLANVPVNMTGPMLRKTGAIRATGFFFMVKLGSLQECCVTYLSDEVKHESIAPTLKRSESIELSFLSNNSAEPGRQLRNYLLRSPRGIEEGNVVGMGRLDRDLSPKNMFFLILTLVRRQTLDLW